MSEPTEPATPDARKAADRMVAFAERSQKIMQAFWERQAADGGFQNPDPMIVSKAFLEMGAKMMANPQKLAEAQAKLWQGYTKIFKAASKKLAGEETQPVVEPAKDDRRFKDKAWSEQALFDAVKQTYLLTANWMQDTFRGVEDLDDKARAKIDFYTRQYVDALSPSNFVATNPQVLEKTIETGGENLLDGMDHLLGDLEKGRGRLRISMTDMDAFTLGENVATTPGKVVFQTDLMQLIQYTPATDTAFKRPLLIVPPWINKFYILDLQPKNSFIKWAVDQGHTVFVISWVNPDETHADKRFEDYMLEGPLAAIGAALEICGADKLNLIGYCIGGTLTACTLPYT
ncbi:MAG: class I poly(R)-hydroxyalkanoic acid synthase, partial [Rhodospirillaceae bacterium]